LGCYVICWQLFWENFFNSESESAQKCSCNAGGLRNNAMRCDAMRYDTIRYTTWFNITFVAHTRLYLTRLFCKIRFVQQRVATNGSDGQRTKCLIRIRRSKTFLFMITSIFICDALIRVLYPQSLRHLVLARALLWYHRCSFIETWIKKSNALTSNR